MKILTILGIFLINSSTSEWKMDTTEDGKGDLDGNDKGSKSDVPKFKIEGIAR